MARPIKLTLNGLLEYYHSSWCKQNGTKRNETNAFSEMILEMILEVTELWTAVNALNLARIGAKICENVFQAIPEICFLTPKKICCEIFGWKTLFFSRFCEVSDDAQPNRRHHQLVLRILL